MNNRDMLMGAIRREMPRGGIPYTYEARSESDAIFRRYLGLGERESVAAHFGCNELTSLWAATGRGPALPERAERNRARTRQGESIDIWGVRRATVQAGSAAYSEVVEYPLAYAETARDVEAYDWPTPDEVVFPALPAGFDIATWKADKVVIEMGFIGPFGIPWYMMGMEKLMMGFR